MSKNLFEYLSEKDPESLRRMVGSVIKYLGIPPRWREDIAQQIYLAWLERTYDPERKHREIMSYAMRCARFAGLDWRRKVVLPATTHRGGEDNDPQGVTYDTVEETNAWVIDPELMLMDSITPEDVADEDAWDAFTSHCISLPSKKYVTTGLTYPHLIDFMSAGLDVSEIAEVAQLAPRSIYRRIEALKHENHYRV